MRRICPKREPIESSALKKETQSCPLWSAGTGINSVTRTLGVSKITVLRLLADAGRGGFSTATHFSFQSKLMAHSVDDAESQLKVLGGSCGELARRDSAGKVYWLVLANRGEHRIVGKALS